MASNGQLTKSANCSSTTGRSPIQAAPMAAPTKPSSEIGVSITRSSPNSSNSPFVTPNAPAEMADVLAEQEDPLVLAQRVGERVADRLEVRDLALIAPRAELIPTPSGASRDILGTVSSRYANHPRAFATYDRVGRRRGVAPEIPLSGGHSAVDEELRAGDVGRLVREQEERRRHDLLDLREPSSGVASTISVRSRSTASRRSVSAVST